MEVVSGEGARRCRCQSPDNRDRLLQSARIPPRYQHCTIQGYEAANDELSKWAAKMEAQIIIDDYLSLEGRGLLLTGPVGVGKTHLAVAILRELIARYQARGLFYQFGALLRQIQDSYNPVSQNSELAVLAPVFNAEVLVLDELGASKADRLGARHDDANHQQPLQRETADDLHHELFRFPQERKGRRDT